MESGEQFGLHGDGDHVKAAWRENGFELSLLTILYKIEQRLGFIVDALENKEEE